MNDSEKRRQQLLQETRKLYSEKGMMPAVHPRYEAAYHKLYGNDGAAVPKGTFVIRLLLCVFFFVLFITVDRQNETILSAGSNEILNQIRQDMNLEGIWNRLDQYDFTSRAE